MTVWFARPCARLRQRGHDMGPVSLPEDHFAPVCATILPSDDDAVFATGGQAAEG